VNIYEELAVLEQGEDGAVVSIRGEGAPCVLLRPPYLGHLAGMLEDLSDDTVNELRAFPRFKPLLDLYAEMRTLLNTYKETCHKYGSALPMSKSLQEIQDELDALAAQLARL
jgi:hypothetical protein